MERSILVERKVRAHPVVVGRVIRQQMTEVPFPQHLWLPKIISWLAQLPRWATLIAGMIGLLKLLGALLVGLLRSHVAREAEMAFLRQQLVVLKRSAPARLRLRTADRLIFVWLYRLFPSLLEAAVVFKPETLVRWHRSGFRLYWRW